MAATAFFCSSVQPRRSHDPLPSPSGSNTPFSGCNSSLIFCFLLGCNLLLVPCAVCMHPFTELNCGVGNLFLVGCNLLLGWLHSFTEAIGSNRIEWNAPGAMSSARWLRKKCLHFHHNRAQTGPDGRTDAHSSGPVQSGQTDTVQ